MPSKQHYSPSLPPNSSNSRAVRIFVLETDEPHPDTQTEHGSFGQILHRHFSKAGAAHDLPVSVETDQLFIVSDEPGGRMPTVDEFDGYDGLLITGSMYDVHGDNPWILDLLKLLKELWIRKPNFYFTGVCFGHQLLARLLGATVAPSPNRDWELGHCRITLTPLGQKLFSTTDSHIYLHQMHQDQVTSPPTVKSAAGLLPPSEKEDVECWGYSEHTPVQGLYVPDRLFSTQAHLAFDEDMVKRQIEMRIESGGIQDMEHADRAAETAHLEHDGDVVAAAILRLFSGMSSKT